MTRTVDLGVIGVYLVFKPRDWLSSPGEIGQAEKRRASVMESQGTLTPEKGEAANEIKKEPQELYKALVPHSSREESVLRRNI